MPILEEDIKERDRIQLELNRIRERTHMTWEIVTAMKENEELKKITYELQNVIKEREELKQQLMQRVIEEDKLSTRDWNTTDGGFLEVKVKKKYRSDWYKTTAIQEQITAFKDYFALALQIVEEKLGCPPSPEQKAKWQMASFYFLGNGVNLEYFDFLIREDENLKFLLETQGQEIIKIISDKLINDTNAIISRELKSALEKIIKERYNEEQGKRINNARDVDELNTILKEIEAARQNLFKIVFSLKTTRHKIVGSILLIVIICALTTFLFYGKKIVTGGNKSGIEGMKEEKEE